MRKGLILGLAVISISLTSVTVYTDVFGEDFQVWTDKQSYTNGDVISINGIVEPLPTKSPLTIIVKNPSGDLVQIGEVEINDNPRFLYEIKIDEKGAHFRTSSNFN